MAVTKRLTLIGHHATVDAAGQTSPANGFFIWGAAAAGTSVPGFTIRNAGLEGILVLKTSNVTIEHDTLIGNDAYGTSNPLCTRISPNLGSNPMDGTVAQRTAVLLAARGSKSR